MKKLMLIAAVATSLVVVSCGQSAEEIKKDQDSLAKVNDHDSDSMIKMMESMSATDSKSDSANAAKKADSTRKVDSVHKADSVKNAKGNKKKTK